jgi:peptidoglycan/LPS O-acetylase OafA/YrhL
MEPPHSWPEQIGVTTPHIVAGFMGGVLSLAFVKQLSVKQVFLSVFAGAVTAAYMTPVVMGWLGWELKPHLSNATAFMTGFLAMNILAMLLVMGSRLKEGRPMGQMTDAQMKREDGGAQ